MYTKEFYERNQTLLLVLLNLPVIGSIIRARMGLEDYIHPVLKVEENSIKFLLGLAKYRSVIYTGNTVSYMLHNSIGWLFSIFHSFDMGYANVYAPALNLGFDTYTSQPDETSSNDAWMDSSASTSNFGADNPLRAGYRGDLTTTRRSLIKFDMSSIPSSATLSSVTLTVVIGYTSGAATLNVHRLLRNWVESQATWTVYSTGNNWGTGGAGNSTTDYDGATLSGSIAISSTGSKNISLSTTQTKSMIDGTYSNYGWRIFTNGATDPEQQINSSSNATAADRPKLVIEYTNVIGRFRSLLGVGR